MKLVGVVVVTLLAGFVAFQNCQQSPHPDDLSNTNDQSVQNKIDLKGHKISEVRLLITEDETVTRESGNYQIQVNKTFKISLPSGEIAVSSDLNDQVDRYCLTETLTNEVTQILKTSQVCKKTDPNPDPNQVCTMAIKPPYAEVVTEKETFSLGGATNGCGSNGIDLCGEQAAVFQGFIASVKTNYKSFSCP